MDLQNLFVVFFSAMGAMCLDQVAPSFASFASAQGAAPHMFEIIDRESKIGPLSSKGEKPASCSGYSEFRSVSYN